MRFINKKKQEKKPQVVSLYKKVSTPSPIEAVESPKAETQKVKETPKVVIQEVVDDVVVATEETVETPKKKQGRKKASKVVDKVIKEENEDGNNGENQNG